LPTVLRSLPRVDLFFHDSDHSYRNVVFELTVVSRKLAKDGVILADDVEAPETGKAFEHFCTRAGANWRLIPRVAPPDRALGIATKILRQGPENNGTV